MSTPECGSNDPHAPHGFHREPDLNATWWCMGALATSALAPGVAAANRAVEVLHDDAHAGACTFTDPFSCPEWDDACDIVRVLVEAGFTFTQAGRSPMAEPIPASVAYPQHRDPMRKFQPGGWPCGPGQPVEDTATLFDGEPCCSSCRSRMNLVDAVWVHDDA